MTAVWSGGGGVVCAERNKLGRGLGGRVECGRTVLS